MSDEDLELLVTLDDPVDMPEEDHFNHFQPENVLEFWLRRPLPGSDDDGCRVAFGEGDWTCTVSSLADTRNESARKLDVEVCTVTHWKNGEIVEQKQYLDLFGMQKQIGIM